MRKFISVILLAIIAAAVILALVGPSIGAQAARHSGRLQRHQAHSDVNFGRYYNNSAFARTKAGGATGAANVVTSVVVNYRGLDTLGEVTVLFVAALGLSTMLYAVKQRRPTREPEPASLIVSTGCRSLFPLIILFGTYIFVHGHLTPGGGFQGGAVIAAGFLLIYLGCRGRLGSVGPSLVESFSGLFFVLIGLVGLAVGGSFLFNFLPAGTPYFLFSAGVIPLIYIAIGLKVGAELGGIIADLAGGAK